MFLEELRDDITLGSHSFRKRTKIYKNGRFQQKNKWWE